MRPKKQKCPFPFPNDDKISTFKTRTCNYVILSDKVQPFIFRFLFSTNISWILAIDTIVITTLHSILHTLRKTKWTCSWDQDWIWSQLMHHGPRLTNSKAMEIGHVHSLYNAHLNNAIPGDPASSVPAEESWRQGISILVFAYLSSS